MTFADFQALIRRMYLEKDAARGAEATFLWFIEEVGELATAVRTVSSERAMFDSSFDNSVRENIDEEMADCFAWLTTLANILGVDLTAAITRKYGTGCPGCGQLDCTCPDSEKP
ncbi:MAG: MazG nucleotide pyrophosphohydrolase domain-containing protein [Thermoguttaceae bacterium]